MDREIEELLDKVVISAMELNTTNLITDINYYLISGVLNKSDKIPDACKTLGISKDTITKLKAAELVTDRTRSKGRPAKESI